MKILQLLTAALLLPPLASAQAQSGEFAKNDNGLIYSDKAITRLRHITDSLNLKFKTCDNKTFYAVTQQQAVYIEIEGYDAIRLKKDIESGHSFDEIAPLYPDSVIAHKAIALKEIEKDYKGRDEVTIKLIFPDGDDKSIGFTRDEYLKARDFKKGWIYKFYEKTDYNDIYIKVCYLKDAFVAPALPEKYARLVQYSECMVDTTTTVYLPDAVNTGRVYKPGRYKKLMKFHDAVDKKLNRPRFNPPKEILTEAKIPFAAVIDTTTYFRENEKLEATSMNIMLNLKHGRS